MARSATRGARGKSHASGSAHTAYQGSRTGPSKASRTRDQPHAAPSASVDDAPASARRHTSRPSRTIATSSTTPKARRTVHPSVPKLSTSTTRPITADGASQPSCVASPSMPSVGSSSWK